VLAFFLVFKDVWEYHYVMLLPVLTALSFRYRSALIPWLGLMFAIPTPYALVVDANGSLSELGGLIQHASKAVPCFLLFLWVIATARREARAGVENRGAASPAAAR
jgi:hypothetical protein